MTQYLGPGGVIPTQVTALPATGANGQLLAISSTGELFVWSEGAWNGISANGSAVLNFGAGASDTSVQVSAPFISAASVVSARILVAASTDHTADEHWVEELEVYAGNIVAGTGFTIYGRTRGPFVIYGHFNVTWEWN